MHVRFWGTRGSIATPGPDTNHFGGNTSCVELIAAGERIIFDCGTGARPLGAALAAGPEPIRATFLLSHTHWDHIQGFPFFAPFFRRDNIISVYAPKGGRSSSLYNVLAGQMEYTYFPVQLDQLPACIVYHELGEGAFEIGAVRVVTQFLHHTAVTLGYRVETEGCVAVYLADHEPFSEELWTMNGQPGRLKSILHPGDRQHAQFMQGADLVIHDAQYTPEEYPAKKNWGHSHFAYVVQLAAAAGVRTLALTHHDPTRNDALLAEIEHRARDLAARLGSPMEVLCAYETLEVELPGADTVRPVAANRIAEQQSRLAMPARILVADDDPHLGLSLLAGI
jgi:phosphoribosyl 1,2-cyclic phosphodiesterase